MTLESGSWLALESGQLDLELLVGCFSDHYGAPRFQPYVRERRLMGSAPIALYDIAQPPGDFSDPPLDDLLITVARTSHRIACEIDGTRSVERVGAGHLLMLKPGTASTTVFDDPNAFLVATIPAAAAEFMFEQIGEGKPIFRDSPYIELRPGVIDTAPLNSLWELAGATSRTPDLVADSALVVFLYNFLAAASPGAVSVKSTGGLAPWQLKRVVDYLNDKLSENTALPDLAALTGLSEHHLCRAFKVSMGLPPHRYQIARRIARARELLEKSPLSVAEVAEQVGYSDVAYFTRLFRRETGLPPAQWRRARSM